MRVLLDECVARQLASDLVGLDVSTVSRMGWAGVKNGALINLAAESGMDAIFTVDRDFASDYPGEVPVGVVILEAGTTSPVRLRAHMPRVLQALHGIRRGEVRRIRV